MDNKTFPNATELECSSHKKVKIDGDVVLFSNSEVQRVPTPSDDPNDPLNAKKWRRVGVLAATCWFSIFSLLSLSGLGTIFNTLFGIYGKDHSPETIVGLSTYPTMLMTVGSLILLPISFVIGRRPVFLIAVIICFVCFITAGLSQSFESHFLSRVFIGLATGTTETLLPLIISDVTFLNERNFYFGFYWATQNCAGSAILIALPYLIAADGWRWYYWFFVITMGLSLVLAIFFLPETRFSRPPMAFSGKTVYTDEFGHTHVLTHEEAQERFGRVQTHLEAPKPKRTFVQELQPWSDIAPNALSVWLGAYAKILKSCTSPAVIFALLLSSISLGIGIAITLVYSSLLVVQYHWSPESVGLFNVGNILASFMAMFYSGWLGDKMNIWLAKRNNGVHKPEHQLVHLLVPCLTGILGLVAVAVPANNPEKYSAWGMVVGWAIFQFSFTCILITSTTFAAEVIPQSPGAAMIVVVGGKNLVAFGAAQGIIPMVAKYSYLTAFMILMGIFIAISILGIPVYFLNRKWRKIAASEVEVSED